MAAIVQTRDPASLKINMDPTFAYIRICTVFEYSNIRQSVRATCIFNFVSLIPQSVSIKLLEYKPTLLKN